MAFGRQLRALLTINLTVRKKLWPIIAVSEFFFPILIGFGIFSSQDGGIKDSGVTITLVSIAFSFINIFQNLLTFAQMAKDDQTMRKETLKIMSMKNGVYGLSYFLPQLLSYIIMAIIMSLIFYFQKIEPTFSHALQVFIIVILSFVGFLFMTFFLTSLIR